MSDGKPVEFQDAVRIGSATPWIKSSRRDVAVSPGASIRFYEPMVVPNADADRAWRGAIVVKNAYCN